MILGAGYVGTSQEAKGYQPKLESDYNIGELPYDGFDGKNDFIRVLSQMRMIHL